MEFLNEFEEEVSDVDFNDTDTVKEKGREITNEVLSEKEERKKKAETKEEREEGSERRKIPKKDSNEKRRITTSSRGGSRGGKGNRGGRGGKIGSGGERRMRYFMLPWTVKDEGDKRKYSGLIEKLVKIGEWHLRLTKEVGELSEEEGKVSELLTE